MVGKSTNQSHGAKDIPKNQLIYRTTLLLVSGMHYSRRHVILRDCIPNCRIGGKRYSHNFIIGKQVTCETVNNGENENK